MSRYLCVGLAWSVLGVPTARADEGAGLPENLQGKPGPCTGAP